MNAGRELDALVAEKVMGWVDYDTDTESWRIGESDLGTHWRPVEGARFSKDIAAAWEVVGYMRAKDEWAFSLGTDTDGDWDATFWEGDTFHDATADTAPHTICLAALKAIGAEV